MSGIAGYWSYASNDIPAQIFASFVDSLAHRGPDGCGIDHFPDTRLWLGHRCLSLERADDLRQPLADSQRRFWLSFDGTIQNDRELRDTLAALGHRFVSHSTAELVIAAYVQWSADCLQRFDGAWALAIWDSRDRRLFLARDNFGIKPLHYSKHGGAIAFASELKAFLRLPWISGTFDPDIVLATLGNIDEQETSAATLLPGVFRLPAGHAVTIDISGTINDDAWWNGFGNAPKPASTLNAQAAEFRTLLLDSCERCVRSDAPFAIEQSGGLDSSAIACSVAALDRREAVDKCHIAHRRAFIACTPDARYNEYIDARIVADYAGATLHRVDVDDRQALDVIERVIFDHETIFGFPRVGAWMLYRAMHAAGIRVSLAGLGIDDTLGSDTDYVEAALDTALKQFDLRRYRDLRRVLRGMAGGNVDIGRATAWGEMYWLLRRAGARLHLLEMARRVFGRQRPVFLHPRTSTQHRAEEIEPRQHGAPLSLDAKRFRDFQRITPLYLASFDRASAAHGLETRFPFMDQRLVAYALALPEESRNGGGCTKRVLRQAMAGIMPDAIRLRTRKTAFTVPLDEWSRGALKPWLLDLCASRAFLESDVWRGPVVRRAVEYAVAGKASLYPIWPILQAYTLERAFIARAAQPIPTAQGVCEHEMAVP